MNLCSVVSFISQKMEVNESLVYTKVEIESSLKVYLQVSRLGCDSCSGYAWCAQVWNYYKMGKCSYLN